MQPLQLWLFRVHFAGRAQGPHQPMSILALAVLPRYSLHRVSQDLPTCSLPWLQPPLWLITCAESPGIPWFTYTSTSALLPRCLLCVEPQVPLVCTHFSFSYPARAPSAQRLQGPPGPHTISAIGSPPRHPAQRILGHSGLHQLQLQLSNWGPST